MKAWLRERVPKLLNVRKIRAEASHRSFFRMELDGESVVAMVYPAPEPESIDRIIKFTELYRAHDIHVPRILRVLEETALIQEDLGDRRLQPVFTRGTIRERRFRLPQVADLLEKLAGIPVEATPAVLDHDRLHWEMEFFVRNFASGRMVPVAARRLEARLIGLVEAIEADPVFAHRDFHSRNMMIRGDEIALVDFQDSLRAPRAYDTVSFAWDGYMDLGTLRAEFLNDLDRRKLIPSQEQLHLTALQRNLKALGTFGFQVNVRGNLSYNRYIQRTLRHVAGNPLALEMLGDSLDSLTQTHPS